jgi:hypothetical protein
MKKLVNLAIYFVSAGLLLLVVTGTASASQYTTTCSSGQWDMLSLMFMQQTYLAENYYLYGTDYELGSNNQWVSNGAVEHNDVPQISTQHDGIWDTGKINSVKDYQGQPDGLNSSGQPQYYAVPPYWGYPWDINLFDDNYVYLWITENNWGDAYSYKEFTNNGSTPYSMLLTRRCVVPGDDGATSQLVNDPPGDGTYTTDFYFVPNPSDGFQYNSNDCTTYENETKGLGYAIMNVLSPESNAFTLQDLVNGGNITLNLLPVTYRYNCSNSTGTCSTKEEYDLGYDASNNDYGIVQWILYTSSDGGSTWTKQQYSQFNQLKQWTSTQLKDGEGGTTVSFPCTPY